MAKVTVTNYLKNVTKSVAYAAADYAKNTAAPELGDLVDTNKEFFVSSFTMLRNPKAALRKAVDSMQKSKVYQAIDYGAKNAFEDLKTGKFYNKEREDRDLLKLSGMGDDWDDLSEFDVDDNGKRSSSDAASEITAGDRKVVASIEDTTAASTKAIINATAVSAQQINKANRANLGVIYNQNERLFSGIHNDISVLGRTMQSLYQMQAANLGNIDKNASTFFTESLKLQQENNAILKEMLEMQRNQYKSAVQKDEELRKKKSNKKKIRWNDINVNGMPDFTAYFENVQANINEQFKSLGLPEFNENSNMLATFMVSPLKGITEYVVKGLVPATVAEATQEFSKSLSGIFGTLIGKFTNMRDKDGIAGIIGKIFGVNVSASSSIDTSRYEKGPVPFDGLTRRAIIDVIPTYLRHIEAALTGNPETMFDYNNGKWVKSNDVKRNFANIRKNAIERGSSSLEEDMGDSIRAWKGGATSKRELESMDDAWKQFKEFLFERNGVFSPDWSESKNKVDSLKYPAFHKHYKAICLMYKNSAIYRDFNGTERVNYSKYLSRSNDVLSAKDSLNAQYRAIEADPSNPIYQLLSQGGFDYIDKHGKWTKNKKGKETFKAFSNVATYKDKLGNTMYDYLSNIYKELIWQRMSWSSGGGNGSAYGPPKPPINIDSISVHGNGYSPENEYYNSAREDEALLKSAMSKIEKGQARRLVDLEEAEAVALIQHEDFFKNMSTAKRNSRIKGQIKSNEISRFMDENVYKQNVYTEDDVKNAFKAAEKEEEKEATTESEKGFVKTVKDLIKKYGSIGGAIGGGAVDAIRNTIYMADRAIYEMMYKTELKDEDDEGSKNKYEGFMDMMAGKINDTFKSISDKFYDNIIKPFKERLGLDDEFKDRFKDSLYKNIIKTSKAFVDTNRDFYDDLYYKYLASPEAAEIRNESKNAKDVINIRGLSNRKFNKAYGNSNKEYDSDTRNSAEALNAATVRKAIGIKGTPEILSNWVNRNVFNGTYDEKLIELKRIYHSKGVEDLSFLNGKSEDELNTILFKIRDRELTEINGRAQGTMGRPFTGLSMLSKGELLFNKSGVSLVNKTDAYNINQPTHILNSEDSYSLLKGMGFKMGAKPSIQSDIGKENVKSRELFGTSITGHAKGSVVKAIKGDGSVDPDKLLEEAKMYVPEALAGGATGGLVGLLFGVPILGAGMGTAANLINSSETLKRMLFGKLDEKTGERDNSGFISKEIVDTVKKYAPAALKGAMIGLVPGLLTPLGPIGGVLVGGAVSMLSKNEEFMDTFFGEEGKLRIGSDEKKIIEDMLPNALKGAGVGAIVGTLIGGPFGLLGNAALGSALGIMGGTEEFKSLLLGVEDSSGVRSGGLLGAVTEAFQPIIDAGVVFKDKLLDALDNNIIKPIQDFITPTVHLIPQLASMLPRMVQTMFDNFFGSSVGQAVKNALSPVGNIAGGIVKGAGSVAYGLTTPFRLLGVAGNAIKRKQIETNNADYMTAAERIAFMGDKASDMDRILASIGTSDFSLEDAKSMKGSLDYITDNITNLGGAERNKFRTIRSLVEGFRFNDGKGINPKYQKKILQAIKDNKTDKIPGLLQAAGLSESELNGMMQGDDLQSLLSQYTDIRSRKDRVKGRTTEGVLENKNKLQAAFKAAGLNIDVSDNYALRKLAKNLDTEIVNREANPEERGLDLDEKRNSMLEQIRNYLAGWAGDINNITSSTGDKTAEKIKKKAEKDVAESTKNVQDNYKNKEIETLGAFSGEKDESFSDSTVEEASRFSRHSGPVGFIIDKAKSAGYKFANKFGITSSDLNTFGGNIFNTIFGTRSNITMDKSAKEYLSELYNDPSAAEKLKRINRFLNNKSIKEFCSITKCKIDAELLKNIGTSTNVGEIIKNASMVIRAKATNKYNTIESIATLTANDKAALVPNHALGTILGIANAIKDIGGTVINGAKAAGSAAISGTKAIGKGVGAIGKGIGNAISSVGNWASGGGPSNMLNGLVGPNAFGAMGAQAASGGMGDASDVDKKGDNRFLSSTPEGMEWFIKKPDNSVEPDMTDAKTKEIENKKSIKEKFMEKLHDAQLKSSEIMEKVFGNANDTAENGNPGKMSLLSLLFAGGILAKTGILGKFYNGFIKPIFTNHIIPWWKNKAWPWIKENVWEPFKGWINDKVKPWVSEKITQLGHYVADKIPEWGSKIATFMANNLPNWITELADGVKDGIIASMPDAIQDILKALGIWTPNNNGDGDGDGGTNSIANAIGHAAGEIGGSALGTYKDIELNILPRAFLQGSKGPGVRLARGLVKGADFLIEHGGTAGKLVGGTTKAVLGPAETAAKFGDNAALALTKGAAERTITRRGLAAGMTREAASATAKGMLATAEKNAAIKGLGELTEASGKKAINAAVKNASKAGLSNAEILAAAGKAGLNSVDDVAKAAGQKGISGLIKKLMDACKNGIDTLLSNSTVINKLKNVCEALGKKLDDTFLGSFKKTLIETFDNAIMKGCKECSEEALKKAASKINVALTVAMIIADFLTGMDQAESILGVNETSLTEEFVAGIVNALCNLLIVPAIIPGVPFICKMIMKFFGVELEERQKEAEAEYQAYIKEHPEEEGKLSKEQYLKEQYSYTGKAGKAIKKGLGKAWEGIKSAGSTAIDNLKNIPALIKSNIEKMKEIVTTGDLVGLIQFNGLGIEGPVGNIIGGMMTSLKLPLIPIVGISFIINKVKDYVVPFIEEHKTIIKNMTTSAIDIFKYSNTGQVWELMGVNSDDKVTGIGKTIIGVAKILALPQALMMWPVKKFSELLVDSIKKDIELIKTGFENIKSLGKIIIDGDSDAWAGWQPAQANVDGLASVTSSVTGIVMKMIGMPLVSISSGLHKIGDFIGKTVNSVININKNTAIDILTLSKIAIDGDVDSLGEWKTSGADEGGIVGAISKVNGFIFKLQATPITWLSHGLHIVGDFIGDVIKRNIEATKNDIENIKSVGKIVIDGDSDAWAEWQPSTTGEGIAHTISTINGYIIKTIAMPLVSISSGLHKVGNFIGKVIDDVKSINIDAPADQTSKLMTGKNMVTDFINYWKPTSEANTKTTLLGKTFQTLSDYMQKIAMAPYALIVGSINNIIDTFSKLGDYITDKLKENEFIDEDGGLDILAGLRKLIEEKADEGLKTALGINNEGTGSFGRGYSKQIDPSIANKRFNARGDSEYQTIGDSACGPTAAVNALESFGRGGAAVLKASQFALSGGYKEKNGGTRPGFFSNYFASNGFYSQTTSNKAILERNISNGAPTVIMGRSGMGASSASPFGRNPHYVTVTGEYGRGGFYVVQDPESPYENQLYPKDTILRQASFGSSVFGRGSSRFGRGRSRYGRASAINYATDPRFSSKNVSSGSVATDKNGYLTAGRVIEIPSGLGKVHTYMGWQCITSPSSTQYKLRESAGMKFDANGFGVICGRYVIACTLTYGNVGDYVDWYKEDGTVIPSVIGDIKSQGDAGCNEWGHQNGACIVEFVVDKNTWYKSVTGVAHPNPGTSNCHPEWGGKSIVKAVNGGSWFNDPSVKTDATVAKYDGEIKNTNPSKGSSNIPGTVNQNSINQDRPSGTPSEGVENKGIGGIVSILSDALANSAVGRAFDIFLNGVPSKDKNNKSSSNTNFNYGDSTNKDAKSAGWESGRDPIYYMRSILGKNQYSQTNRDPEKGGGDCSSTVQWAFRKATGNDIGGTSAAIYTNSSLFDTIAYNNGKPIGPLPNNIEPNDVLLYNRNRSGNPDGVGHVDIYEGYINGSHKKLSHGSGIGPKEQQVGTDSMIKILRYKGGFNGTTDTGSYADAIPVNPPKYENGKKSAMAGDSRYARPEGWTMRNNPNYAAPSNTTTAQSNASYTEAARNYKYNGGNTLPFILPSNNVSSDWSSIASQDFTLGLGTGPKPKSRYGTFKDYGTGSGNFNNLRPTRYGRGTSSNYGRGTDDAAMAQIIAALIAIAENTDNLNLIVSILNERLGTSVTAEEFANNAGKSSVKSQIMNSLNTAGFSKFSDKFGLDNESSLQSIMTELNSIASA